MITHIETRVSKELIQSLIEYGIYDCKYTEHHDGMLGAYTNYLEAVQEKSEQMSDIAAIVVFLNNAVPIGAALALSGSHVPGVNLSLHVFVQPEVRRQGFAKRLLETLTDALPQDLVLAMSENDYTRTLLRWSKRIRAIRVPSALQRECVRSLRALERGDRWINQNGSLLSSDLIAETLRKQHALIVELQKRLDPSDNAILIGLPDPPTR